VLTTLALKGDWSNSFTLWPAAAGEPTSSPLDVELLDFAEGHLESGSDPGGRAADEHRLKVKGVSTSRTQSPLSTSGITVKYTQIYNTAQLHTNNKNTKYNSKSTFTAVLSNYKLLLCRQNNFMTNNITIM